MMTLPAGAQAFSSSCAAQRGGIVLNFSASAGESNRVSVGTSDNRDALYASYSSQQGGDPPSAGSIGCSVERPGEARSVIVLLGDRGDTARADQTIPDFFGGGFVPLPASVDLIVEGQAGADKIVGHPGPGLLNGGTGGDVIKDLGGSDVIKAGPGNDRLDTRDGDRDVVRCGKGNDKALTDRFDAEFGC